MSFDYYKPERLQFFLLYILFASGPEAISISNRIKWIILIHLK